MTLVNYLHSSNIFCMDINNQLITNKPRLSVNMTTLHTKTPLHVTDKLRTNIFSLTMYTQLDYKHKDRSSTKLSCTVTNKTMYAYNPCLYANDRKSCKNSASCKIPMSKFSYKSIYDNRCTRHHTKNPTQNSQYTPLHYYVSVKNIYNTHLLKKTISNFLHHKPNTKPPHLILSCLIISLSENVVGNHPKAPQKIVGGTLLLGSPPPNTPKLWDAT